MDDTGAVKRDVLGRLCRDFVTAGVHGLTTLGPTGEFAYLTREQKLAIIETVVEAAGIRAYPCLRDADLRGRSEAGLACLVPSQSVALYDLCRQGKWDGVITLQRDLWPLNETFAKYNLAACVKGGLSLQGYEVVVPLAPQSPLSRGKRRSAGFSGGWARRRGETKKLSRSLSASSKHRRLQLCPAGGAIKRSLSGGWVGSVKFVERPP